MAETHKHNTILCQPIGTIRKRNSWLNPLLPITLMQSIKTVPTSKRRTPAVASLETKTTSTSESPSHTGIVIKDLALVFAALSIWAAADTWYQVTGLWLANVLAIGDAVLVGLLLAGLAHEWGHYLGARFSNAETTLKGSGWVFASAFRFRL